MRPERWRPGSVRKILRLTQKRFFEPCSPSLFSSLSLSLFLSLYLSVSPLSLEGSGICTKCLLNTLARMHAHTNHCHTHTHAHTKCKVYNFYFTQTQNLAALNKIMIANIIKFEMHAQGVSKIALPERGEKLFLTDNAFLQWQARTKKPISCLERINTKNYWK